MDDTTAEPWYPIPEDEPENPYGTDESEEEQ